MSALVQELSVWVPLREISVWVLLLEMLLSLRLPRYSRGVSARERVRNVGAEGSLHRADSDTQKNNYHTAPLLGYRFLVSAGLMTAVCPLSKLQYG